jgi:hypothetical protein
MRNSRNLKLHMYNLSLAHTSTAKRQISLFCDVQYAIGSNMQKRCTSFAEPQSKCLLLFFVGMPLLVAGAGHVGDGGPREDPRVVVGVPRVAAQPVEVRRALPAARLPALQEVDRENRVEP